MSLPPEERKRQHEEKKKALIEQKFSPVRGENFKNFISTLLRKHAKIPEEKVAIYTQPEHLRTFEQAFTHESFNPDWNYEFLEFFGDSMLNFCVVAYLSQRFPDLNHSSGKGKGILSRLKINMVSKQIFAKCADHLGFSHHIASDMLSREPGNLPSLLEDTFEAFNGALFHVMTESDPNKDKKGWIVGIGPSYRIVMNFFDTIDISTRYEDLYDAKTRLKQLLEKLGRGFPKFFYTEKIDDNNKIVFTTTIKIFSLDKNKEWGVGMGFEKKVSEQNACDHAIRNLNLAGYL